MRMKGIRIEVLLLGWVVREIDALGDVAFQPFHAGLEERLLVLVDVTEGIQSLLNSAGLLRC